ncbi:MAG: hypothetical protein HGGPFJEG_01163 [Ignavibacteria bacterium]|nr:hypothetical protein [Ignavibacteria bacterium]
MRNKYFNITFVKTILILFMIVFNLKDSKSQYQIVDYELKCVAVTNGLDYGRSIINRLENGYAISGYTYQRTSCIGNWEWFLLKLKPNGMVDCANMVGMPRDDRCYSLVQFYQDSGYVLAGYFTNYNSPYRKRASLVKYNKVCTPMVSRAVYDSLNSSYYQVVIDPSNTTAYTGYIQTHITVGQKRNKILASQYSFAGAPNWLFRYNSFGLSTEEALSMCFQPTDGSYGLAAKTNYFSGSSNVFDLMILKLSYAGSIIWKGVYKILIPSSYPNTEPRKIIAMPDGGFVVVGFTNAYGSTQRDIVVLRVSASGTIMWYNTYGSTGLYEQGESITLDGVNLVITGSERTVSPAGPSNVLTMKIPSGGGPPLWTKRWESSNPSEVGYDIIKSNIGATGGGYAVTGFTNRGTDLNNVLLYRVNVDGIVPGAVCNDPINTPWRPNSFEQDSFLLVKQSLNEITNPYTQVNPIVDPDTLCIAPADNPKREDTESDLYDNKLPENKLNQNSPNPFNPTTVINYELSSPGFVTVKIFDISGKLVSTVVNDFRETGRHQVTFDGSSLSSGIYYCKIETRDFVDVKKMILIK